MIKNNNAIPVNFTFIDDMEPDPELDRALLVTSVTVIPSKGDSITFRGKTYSVTSRHFNFDADETLMIFAHSTEEI